MKRIIVFSICLMMTSCSYFGIQHAKTIEDCSDQISQSICDGLEESYRGVSLLVSTPVDVVTLAPSDFGLALQEFLIGAMAKNKANVVDVQLRKEPYITCEDGFVSLSRDASRLKGEFRAEIILVTTYMVRKEKIIITSRAVDFTTNDVITSTTVVLYKSEYVDDLLGSSRGLKVYER